MAVALDLDLARLYPALDKLLEAGLVAHRPWRKALRDGVWQVLPLPPRARTRRSSNGDQPRPTGDLLRDLGVAPRAGNRGS